jgi:hypothetical protein
MSNNTGGKDFDKLYPYVQNHDKHMCSFAPWKNAPKLVISGMINILRTASSCSVYLDARAELEE